MERLNTEGRQGTRPMSPMPIGWGGNYSDNSAMNRIPAMLILALLLFGCSIIPKSHTYEICVSKPSVRSQIIKNETIGIADTTIAFLSGVVSSKDPTDSIVSGIFGLTDSLYRAKYDAQFTNQTRYSITAPAGKYRVKVTHIGYTTLDTTLILCIGEMREFDVAMGKDGVCTICLLYTSPSPRDS